MNERSERIIVRGGRVIDPAGRFDQVADVVIERGRIVRVGTAGDLRGTAIDAAGAIVCPGLVDIHTHLREPGQEYKETIASGAEAAAHGGFTTVCAMPNTVPPIDSRSVVEFIQRQALVTPVRVLVIGCITRGREGKELAEMGELADAGCIGFSDDGSPVADAGLMRRALEYASAFGLPIINHPEEPSLAAGGVMHEGWVATRLGLRGQPAAAEEAMVARDIQLAELTGARLHLTHLSTAGSVDLVRGSKQRGLRVTADVTPHHLTLTHEAVLNAPGVQGAAYDTNAKVHPPLRTPEDVHACVEGLRDGTLDAVATDHAPHAVTDKLCEFDIAAAGLTGLETALGLLLRVVEQGGISLPEAIERLTIGPVRAARLDRRTGESGLGTLQPGAPADLVVFDPAGRWTVTAESLRSKGKNTPLIGTDLQGRVLATIAGGCVAYRAEEAHAGVTDRALLVLADGTVFEGESIGAPVRGVGEIVFNTSMTGYLEILTDPSYAGQIVVMTYPLIGNYGTSDVDVESRCVQAAGLVVREVCDQPSHWLGGTRLQDYLRANNVPAIAGIDTRALTRRIRSGGVLQGTITSDEAGEAALARLQEAPAYEEVNFVQQVSTPTAYSWDAIGDEPRGHIVVVDMGVKYNIMRTLNLKGYRTTAVSCDTNAEDILALAPDGVVLSPGPGDPAHLNTVVRTATALVGKQPMMGICLGHQVLARTFGGRTYKLKFGHHGGNHPVKDLLTGAVHVTSQNHGYAVDADSLRNGVEVSHLNLNDATCEGLHHPSLPIVSIQYHSEAAPGPHDNMYLFDRFLQMVQAEKRGGL